MMWRCRQCCAKSGLVRYLVLGDRPVKRRSMIPIMVQWIWDSDDTGQVS
jgi:hypothetical protein